MLFPESARVLYKNNPLAEVICQFRFPTILRIREKQLAAFQDMIRGDYPVYSEQEPSFGVSPQVPKAFATIIEQMNISVPAELITHRFATKDSQRFVTLRDEFMALAETKYEKWEAFREEILKTTSAFEKVYTPAFYSRVGLRYRDVISRNALGLKGVGWQDLLQPHIIGELGDKGVVGAISGIQTRVIIKIPDIADGQIVLSHGLITQNGSSEECYSIDADFSVERKEGVSEHFKILDGFNRMAGQLFRWAITEKLHDAMGPQTI